MLPVGSAHEGEYLILVPERGLFGYRNEFLTDTKGEGIMSSVFERYEPYKGELHAARHGQPRGLGDRARL